MVKPKKRLMHKRNVFQTPPDYTELAIKYKDFRQVCMLELTGKVSINYKNENTLRQLTRTLLLEYFQLQVQFAPDSLVPTVPLRLNYLLWIEDMLIYTKQQQVHGIDIGCGSSCIYSLLAAKQFALQMTALESNALNIEYATENIKRNQLTEKIQIFEQADDNVIFKHLFKTTNVGFTFCMCNPPFYDTKRTPMDHTRHPEKRAQASNCPTGNSSELMCEGGEVQFVLRIIEESIEFQERVVIYSSMLGHKSSLTKIIEFLNKHNITNYCQTEFNQGNTTRWGIAWSFKPQTDLKQLPD